MCVGIPMQVIAAGPASARCRTRDGEGEHVVDTRLIGEPEPGTWLMVASNVAREVIPEETARQCADALLALDVAMRGDMDFDHLFAGLVGREPQLPEFLRTPAPPPRTAGEVIARLIVLLRSYRADGAHNVVDLSGIDAAELDRIGEVLGEGEVVVSGSDFEAREAVFPGVWRVHLPDASGAPARDLIEIGRFPTAIAALTFRNMRFAPEIPAHFGPGVMNAPLLLAEISEHIDAAAAAGGGEPYVINLTRLPHTDADLEALDRQLGNGGLIIQSDAYGICQASATATRNVWWVRFHNAQGAPILNSIEITPIPEAVRATAEDIALSAERLTEIAGARA